MVVRGGRLLQWGLGSTAENFKWGVGGQTDNYFCMAIDGLEDSAGGFTTEHEQESTARSSLSKSSGIWEEMGGEHPEKQQRALQYLALQIDKSSTSGLQEGLDMCFLCDSISRDCDVGEQASVAEREALAKYAKKALSPRKREGGLREGGRRGGSSSSGSGEAAGEGALSPLVTSSGGKGSAGSAAASEQIVVEGGDDVDEGAAGDEEVRGDDVSKKNRGSGGGLLSSTARIEVGISIEVVDSAEPSLIEGSSQRTGSSSAAGTKQEVGMNADRPKDEKSASSVSSIRPGSRRTSGLRSQRREDHDDHTAKAPTPPAEAVEITTLKQESSSRRGSSRSSVSRSGKSGSSPPRSSTSSSSSSSTSSSSNSSSSSSSSASAGGPPASGAARPETAPAAPQTEREEPRSAPALDPSKKDRSSRPVMSTSEFFTKRSKPAPKPTTEHTPTPVEDTPPKRDSRSGSASRSGSGSSSSPKPTTENAAPLKGDSRSGSASGSLLFSSSSSSSSSSSAGGTAVKAHSSAKPAKRERVPAKQQDPPAKDEVSSNKQEAPAPAQAPKSPPPKRKSLFEKAVKSPASVRMTRMTRARQPSAKPTAAETSIPVTVPTSTPRENRPTTKSERPLEHREKMIRQRRSVKSESPPAKKSLFSAKVAPPAPPKKEATSSSSSGSGAGGRSTREGAAPTSTATKTAVTTLHYEDHGSSACGPVEQTARPAHEDDPIDVQDLIHTFHPDSSADSEPSGTDSKQTLRNSSSSENAPVLIGGTTSSNQSSPRVVLLDQVRGNEQEGSHALAQPVSWSLPAGRPPVSGRQERRTRGGGEDATTTAPSSKTPSFPSASRAVFAHVYPNTLGMGLASPSFEQDSVSEEDHTSSRAPTALTRLAKCVPKKSTFFSQGFC